MAATQTTNNNSIRSILEKEKLNGSNFLDWYRNLRIVLMNEQKLHHLEEALPEAPHATTTVVVRNAYTRRVAEQQEVACLMLAFHACKQEEGQSVSTYVLKIKAYLDQIERLGYPMPLVLGTIPELHAMLKLVEKSIPKKALVVLAIRQGQIQKPKSQARGKGKKRGKGKSKLAYDPKHKIPHLLKRSILLRTLSRRRGYRKLNKGALDLYVGNGNNAAVEAIGSFDFILPSGMILVLDNFSKDNMFYFNSFPLEGIFEIDMHNHISNERSIYTCSNKKTKHNLDSTFLWHCRLGHINKKHIAKLQHDGLLESIDDKSFDVCVSCISVKMARKPFNFVSERAGDLIGIIHSDVCGPFRTTYREGANYYVTFTDDFSRYSYVYLIKHKHEVFEMFKTFQNEVENQLEKTIKALRSDRGREYLSQEFLDHLRSHGIILQLTPPYTTQHNDVSKRRNRTLLDMDTQKKTMGYYFYYPLENKNLVARSARIPQALERYGFYIDAKEHELGDHAMNAEMQSMKDNQVWNLVDLPPNYKTVGSKWLFKKKTDMDGNIHTYKARLVAKSFTQTNGFKFEESLSPVADIKAIRILIAIASYYDYEIW
ncbi:retrotransposon protein, putative, ty1-copia subclass [Tanacetum coccineum]